MTVKVQKLRVTKINDQLMMGLIEKMKSNLPARTILGLEVEVEIEIEARTWDLRLGTWTGRKWY